MNVKYFSVYSEQSFETIKELFVGLWPNADDEALSALYNKMIGRAQDDRVNHLIIAIWDSPYGSKIGPDGWQPYQMYPIDVTGEVLVDHLDQIRRISPATVMWSFQAGSPTLNYEEISLMIQPQAQMPSEFEEIVTLRDVIIEGRLKQKALYATYKEQVDSTRATEDLLQAKFGLSVP